MYFRAESDWPQRLYWSTLHSHSPSALYPEVQRPRPAFLHCNTNLETTFQPQFDLTQIYIASRILYPCTLIVLHHISWHTETFGHVSHFTQQVLWTTLTNNLTNCKITKSCYWSILWLHFKHSEADEWSMFSFKCWSTLSCSSQNFFFLWAKTFTDKRLGQEAKVTSSHTLIMADNVFIVFSEINQKPSSSTVSLLWRIT